MAEIPADSVSKTDIFRTAGLRKIAAKLGVGYGTVRLRLGRLDESSLLLSQSDLSWRDNFRVARQPDTD